MSGSLSSTSSGISNPQYSGSGPTSAKMSRISSSSMGGKPGACNVQQRSLLKPGICSQNCAPDNVHSAGNTTAKNVKWRWGRVFCDS